MSGRWKIYFKLPVPTLLYINFTLSVPTLLITFHWILRYNTLASADLLDLMFMYIFITAFYKWTNVIFLMKDLFFVWITENFLYIS